MASLIALDLDTVYTLIIAVEDRFKAIDLATVRLFGDPSCTEYSIDNGRTLVDGPELINAGTDAFCFTTDVRTNTNVGIANFTSNDKIVVSGVGSVAELNFSTGTGAGADDLYITYNSTATGTLDIIVIGDVITGSGFVFDYASAVAAVGFDFLCIEPCTPVSIDVGTVLTSVAFDASTDAFCFLDGANITTNVVISGFTSDDTIDVSGGVTSADYNFARSFDDINDLVITYSTGPDVTNKIILDDVLPDLGFVSSYATAVAAVGFDFMTFA